MGTTKVFGATTAAKKKLEGGYKPFGKPKKGCTATGCGVPAKPGAAGTSAPTADKTENSAK